MSEPSSTPSGAPPETVTPTGDGQRGFEDAAERLESIVREMENGRLPLEELILRYEEGMKLVEFCSSSLARAEKRIEIIQRTAEGKLEVEPLDDADADAAGDISEEEDAPPASAKKSRQREISPRKMGSAEPATDESDEEDGELSLF